MCEFTFQHPDEHDPYHVLILRDGGGNSVKNNTQFGKVVYHNIPELCSIGALGLWPLARFDITGELDTSDFLDNNSWFNQKLLISTQAEKEKWSK